MAELTTTFRNHVLSLYQSAAADYARRAATEPVAEAVPGAGDGASPEALAAAVDYVAALHDDERTTNFDAAAPADAQLEGPVDIAKTCASLGYQLLQAKIFGDEASVKRLKGELAAGTCDPRWADTVVEYAKYFGLDGTRGKIPYITPAQAGETVVRIKAGARIGLIGDWGTGAAPAVQVLEQLKLQKPDVLVHLGDIYYSGTDEECRVNFEAIVNRVFDRANSKLPVYTLSGNHDMYAGGTGYYPLLKRLNTGALTQPASYFCLRAEDDSWQLLGMDTGLHDYSPVSVTDAVTFVEAEEQAWHRRRITEFGGKTILMSHHQLFSRYSEIGKKDANGKYVPYNKPMKAMFDGFLSTGKSIPAWFWGHEHNLGIYKPFLNLKYGRCLGHSAVPVFKAQDAYKEVEAIGALPDVDPAAQLPLVGNTYAHGFGMLTLGSDGKAKVDYFNTGGGKTPFFSETME
jgi:predicted phosphodiesterase